jgi:hypothetical protein
VRRRVDGGPRRLLVVHGLPDDEMNSFDAALFLNLSWCGC